MLVTASEKGQITIPADIMGMLGIAAGTRLDIVPDVGGFKVVVGNVRKTKTAADCIGISGYEGKHVSADEMDASNFDDFEVKPQSLMFRTVLGERT
jgi:AbrB family looped-hinge helix DNA binding protein